MLHVRYMYATCTLQVGTSCDKNGFELLCTVLTYPPAWSWVGLPGSSCKPAPPGAGGAVTTGDWKITIRTIYHDISGYIFQNISVEINCGQLLTDVLINPGLRQYKFGHFVLGEFPLWLVAEQVARMK